jgi:Flp pilus assembly protein TadG
MTRLRRGDRGASTVEFALVVPVFLALIGISGYFAWQMYSEAELDRAAQRAARFAAVPATQSGHAYRQCAVVDDLNTHLSSVRVTSADVRVSDTTGPLAQAACPNADPATTPRGYVRVRVTRVLDNPFTDVLGFFTGRPHPVTLTGSGEARVEDAT